MTVYVIAANRKEAETLVDYGWKSRADAESQLCLCKSPPTDPFYGNHLSIYAVEVEAPCDKE